MARSTLLSSVFRRRPVTLLLAFVCVSTCFLYFLLGPPSAPVEFLQQIQADFYFHFNPDEALYCYTADNYPRLPQLQDDPTPPPDRSIFFFETSCKSFQQGGITLNARQACAVESAALRNPEYDVFLTFMSPGLLRNQGNFSDRLLAELATYPNIHFRHLNFEQYLNDTELISIYKNGKLQHSKYAQSHASDLLRYVTLFKFGGIYLDLDVVVVRSFSELNETNYAGAESDDNVAAGVMRFSTGGVGHELATKCLNDLGKNYKANEWGSNGPGVITRLAQTLCKAKKAINMKRCQGMKIYPPSIFYPIPWWNWTLYFDTNSVQKVFDMARGSYTIHVWNKHSAKTIVPKGQKTAYTEYASSHCPKVFNICDKYF